MTFLPLSARVFRWLACGLVAAVNTACGPTVPHLTLGAPVTGARPADAVGSASASTPTPVDTPARAQAPPGPSFAPTSPPAETGPRTVRLADFGATQPSADARHVADWIVDSGDHAGLPFIVLDKRAARMHVFDADGRQHGTSPVLLGLAKGDDSVPGIGERRIADILPAERTTPAGRFHAEMGRNAAGEDIIWIDYDSAVSMHRVRANVPAERRLQRLASATPSDNRISYGCINVPVAFYDRIVTPLFAANSGIVYVLPETRPAREVFGSYDVAGAAATPPGQPRRRTRPG